MNENAGNIVLTKNGKRGRTYCNDLLINGKVPVYLAEEYNDKDNYFEFSETKKLLCSPESLTIIGYID